jgi:isopenicillin-N N-acyltransferase-like protein
MMAAWLQFQVPPNARRLRFAGRCWAELEHWKPPIAEFVRGMAAGSGLSLPEVTLLLLHEEIGHSKLCTAFAATGAGTRDGKPIIGQNWDWSSTLYPWSCLVRLATDAMPSTLTYAYPGLWTAAGMNEHGLSLVWTSSGSFPKLPPRVGIPTYALIAGIFACEDCQSALAMLRASPIAGCFIFFIADARGEAWGVEGFSGQFEAEQCADVISRANHYECERSCRLTHQKLPRTSRKMNSRARANRMAEMLRERNGRIDEKAAEALLRDHSVGPGLNICQHPAGKRKGMTLDSFYLLPARKEMRIARGLPCRHEYRRYRV